MTTVKREIEAWFDGQMDALTRFYRRQDRKIALVDLDRARPRRAGRTRSARSTTCAATRTCGPSWPSGAMDFALGPGRGRRRGARRRLRAGARPRRSRRRGGGAPARPVRRRPRRRYACSRSTPGAPAPAGRGPPLLLPSPSAPWTELRREGDPDRYEAGRPVGRWLAHRIPGRIIAVVALLFGAQFWYDVLRRLVGLRTPTKRRDPRSA